MNYQLRTSIRKRGGPDRASSIEPPVKDIKVEESWGELPSNNNPDDVSMIGPSEMDLPPLIKQEIKQERTEDEWIADNHNNFAGTSINAPIDNILVVNDESARDILTKEFVAQDMMDVDESIEKQLQILDAMPTLPVMPSIVQAAPMAPENPKIFPSLELPGPSTQTVDTVPEIPRIAGLDDQRQPQSVYSIVQESLDEVFQSLRNTLVPNNMDIYNYKLLAQHLPSNLASLYERRCSVGDEYEKNKKEYFKMLTMERNHNRAYNELAKFIKGGPMIVPDAAVDNICSSLLEHEPLKAALDAKRRKMSDYEKLIRKLEVDLGKGLTTYNTVDGVGDFEKKRKHFFQESMHTYIQDLKNEYSK